MPQKQVKPGHCWQFAHIHIVNTWKIQCTFAWNCNSISQVRKAW